MTHADIRTLADGEDESPMGALLRACADVVEAAEDLMRIEDQAVTQRQFQLAERLADSLGALRRLRP